MVLLGALRGPRRAAGVHRRARGASARQGALLDFLAVHDEHGPVGVTGLSEYNRRDRRATVGTWFGRDFWGTGINAESKALIARLAFETLGFHRLTAWANTRNGRSQTALERARLPPRGRPARLQHARQPASTTSSPSG